MKEKNNLINLKCIKYMMISSIIGLSISIFITFLSAILIVKFSIPNYIQSIMSTISLALSGFTAGIISSKFIKSKGILFGFLTGIILSIYIILVSLLIFSSGITMLGISKLFIIIICSTIGGILGVNLKRKI
ncbi:MAG: TIGR04086 family membrane protein [Oscillospiraceae bacterium]|nr:TIGR04086 family membrane protein [Oscillospiraceae bacterium]